jgi:hypothetical protein
LAANKTASGNASTSLRVIGPYSRVFPGLIGIEEER